MKQYNQIIFLALMALLFCLDACTKDNSNTGVKALKEVGISDSVVAQTVQMSDTLKLNPVFNHTAVQDTSAYEYTWEVYDNSPSTGYDAPRTVIANTRYLNYVVKGNPFTIGHQYRLIYGVKDKSTGVSNYLYYELSIVGSYAQGWLFLENHNDSTDLTMMKSDSVIYRHLYSGLLSYQPLGSPRQVSLTTVSVTDDLADPGKRLYLLGSNNLVQLDYNSMEVQLTTKALFFSVPVLNPQWLQWTVTAYGTNGDGVIINDNKVYYNLTGGFPGVKEWGGMLLSVNNGLSYAAFPVLAYTTYTSSAPISKAVYDNTNKKFLLVSSTNLTEVPASLSDPAIFSMNNVGLTMVYMGIANGTSQWSCIMKNDNGDAYYLRFTTAAGIAISTLVKQKIGDNRILKADSWAGSTLTPHLFYNSGNVLYRYETTSNTISQLYAFPSGEQITKIYFDASIIRNGAPTLIVATYNGSQGKVYYLPVDALGNVSSPTKTFTGFDKIVDINYKS